MSTAVTIDLRGTKETRTRLAKMQGGLTKAMRRAMLKSVGIVRSAATRSLRGRILHVDTGRLWQSLQTWVSSDGRRGRVGTNVEYARIHEYGGTIEHPGGTAFVINDMARVGAGRLVFIDNDMAAGFDLPRTRPHAITIPARPYMRPALKDSFPAIREAFRSEIGKLLKGSGGKP